MKFRRCAELQVDGWEEECGSVAASAGLGCPAAAEAAAAKAEAKARSLPGGRGVNYNLRAVM